MADHGITMSLSVSTIRSGGLNIDYDSLRGYRLKTAKTWLVQTVPVPANICRVGLYRGQLVLVPTLQEASKPVKQEFLTHLNSFRTAVKQ